MAILEYIAANRVWQAIREAVIYKLSPVIAAKSGRGAYPQIAILILFYNACFRTWQPIIYSI